MGSELALTPLSSRRVKKVKGAVRIVVRIVDDTVRVVEEIRGLSLPWLWTESSKRVVKERVGRSRCCHGHGWGQNCQ